MKRHNHPIGNSSCTLWDAICSMDNLKLAHQNAKKGKGWYKEVMMVDENPEYYLGLLQQMLITKTYHTSEYQTFYKNDGNKKRLNGLTLTYSEWCSINSYKGWVIHCDGYRLEQKYIQPLQQYANQFYIQNIKTKG